MIKKYRTESLMKIQNDFLKEDIKTSDSIAEINSFVVLDLLIENMKTCKVNVYDNELRKKKRQELGQYWPGRPPDQE